MEPEGGEVRRQVSDFRLQGTAEVARKDAETRRGYRGKGAGVRRLVSDFRLQGTTEVARKDAETRRGNRSQTSDFRLQGTECGTVVPNCSRLFRLTRSQRRGTRIATQRVSEGRKREDVASDVSPSLAYASGYGCWCFFPRFLPSLTRFEVALSAVAIASSQFLPGIIITRRVSEGRMREDVASDVTPSLAYASGCD